MLDAERGRPFLKDIQQALALDAAEAMTAALDRAPAEVHVDVVPVMEALDDGIVGGRIHSAKARHGLVREHDAPAERIVGTVTLVHLDLGVRQGLLEENGGIQARRASAETDDALHE